MPDNRVTQLFRFTEYLTLRRIFIAARTKEQAVAEAKKQGDFRTLEHLGEVTVLPVEGV